MNLNEFFEQNYKIIKSNFKNYIYLNYKNRISEEEYEDFFNDCTILLIDRVNNKDLPIVKDYKYYFIMIMKNEIRRFIKKKDKDNLVELEENDSFTFDLEKTGLKEDAINLLKSRMRNELNDDEYYLLLNFLNNKKISYKKIAEIIGMPQNKIYILKTEVFRKIRKEIEENFELYFL